MKGVFVEDFRALRLQPLAEVKIKDVDLMATNEDVIEVFQRNATEGDSIDCNVPRSELLGMQVAADACSVQLARKVVAQRKIKIRLVVSRVSAVPRITRCFACHDFGHMAARCPVNRTGREICLGEYHQVKECKVPISCCLCNRRKYGNLSHLAGSAGYRTHKEEIARTTGAPVAEKTRCVQACT